MQYLPSAQLTDFRPPLIRVPAGEAPLMKHDIPAITSTPQNFEVEMLEEPTSSERPRTIVQAVESPALLKSALLGGLIASGIIFAVFKFSKMMR